MVVFIPTWVTLVGWFRVAHLMMITFMMTMTKVKKTTMITMVPTIRMIAQ